VSSELEPDVQAGEIRIRPSVAHRRRAALSAAVAVGSVLLPVGLLLGILSRSWGVLLVFLFAAVMVAVSSFVGQAHNEIFVGPLGLRRVSRNCSLLATWQSLERLDVKIPGNRIVAFTLVTSGVSVKRLTTGHSNAAEALVRHPPEGFELRFDREAADAVVDEISRRRPDLTGASDWETASRPK